MESIQAYLTFWERVVEYHLTEAASSQEPVVFAQYLRYILEHTIIPSFSVD